jgi:hypothetical protein
MEKAGKRDNRLARRVDVARREAVPLERHRQQRLRARRFEAVIWAG